MNFRYLRPEDLRKLDSFEFAPRLVVEGWIAGRHRSFVVGSSTEFRDYRPYAPGDDLRLVDWRVFARTDRYYLRTHNQETNTACHVVLDSSASMGFGDPPKLAYASFFAAAVAYLVTRGGDAVSLLTHDDGVRQFFPAGSTTAHLHRLLHALERNEPGRPTSVAAALQRAAPLLRGRGTLLVLSDFFDDAGAIFTALNPFIHRGFDVHLFHVLAPAELDLPARGLVAFEDLETRERLTAHTETLRAGYAAAMRAHVTNLRELARRRGLAYTLARTDASWFNLFDRLVE
jgi:uncharacterized protein (DUF58 family)